MPGHRLLAGSSVHNQRIERHNRAVNEQVFDGFKAKFYDLERQGILNPLNDTDMFCLHYVYLPRINEIVSEFIDAHNNHTLSTEGNKFQEELTHASGAPNGSFREISVREA